MAEPATLIETSLRRNIRDALAAGTTGIVDDACIQIEAEAQHSMPNGDWAAGLKLYAGEEGYEFATSRYWEHVMTCDNQAHLEPVYRVSLYCKAPRQDLYVELLKHDPANPGVPVDDADAGATAWQAWTRARSDEMMLLSLVRCIQAEQSAVGEGRQVDRRDLETRAEDLGLTGWRFDEALDSLIGWSQLTGHGRISARSNQRPG